MYRIHSVCLVIQQTLEECPPHVSDWIFGGEQKHTSSLLSGSLCSIKGSGQSALEEYCLKRIKTKEPDLDGGVKKAFLRKCFFTEPGGLSRV